MDAKLLNDIRSYELNEYFCKLHSLRMNISVERLILTVLILSQNKMNAENPMQSGERSFNISDSAE